MKTQIDELISLFTKVAKEFYLKLHTIELISLEFISSDEKSMYKDNDKDDPFIGKILSVIPTIECSYVLGDGTLKTDSVSFEIPFDKCDNSVSNSFFISGIIYNTLYSILVSK